MSADEFWYRVGLAFRNLREDRRLNYSEVSRTSKELGQPITDKTIEKIDHGEIGNVSSLSAYAAALGLSIVDVVRSVVAERPFTPEANLVARTMDEELRENVLARRGFVDMARSFQESRRPGPEGTS
jgi:hypothetical protein